MKGAAGGWRVCPRRPQARHSATQRPPPITVTPNNGKHQGCLYLLATVSDHLWLHVEGSSYKPAPPSDYLLSCRDCWGLTLELPPGPARPLAAGSPGWGVCRTLWLRTPAAVGTSCVGLTRSPQRSRRWGVVTLGMECAPHCHLTSGTKTPQRAVASLEGLQPACLFQGLVPRIPKEAKDDLVPTCHWK